MSKSSDLNVSLTAMYPNDLTPIFPKDLNQEDLLSFLKFSTDLAADEVFWMRSNSEIIYVNHAACEKLEYERHELIGKCVWEWDPLFPKEVWPKFWEELKEKKHIDYETIHQNKHGDIFPVRIKGHFFQHGEDELLFAFVSDISDIKLKEEALKKNSEDLVSLVETRTAERDKEKEKFEKFVNLAPVGIAINRMEDGGFEYINNEFSRFTGYTIEELNSMDYWQLTPKKYEQHEYAQLASMEETGRYGPYKKEYIHKKGHYFPVQLSGIKITDSEGNNFIWSVVQDISLQKRFEKQLQDAKINADLSALRMSLANDSAGIGVWEWDIPNNALIWDEWMYKLYGVIEDDFSGKFDAWESRVHPDDIRHAKAQLEDTIKGRGKYAPEYRIVLPSGECRYVKASAEVICDDDGKAVRVIGVNYDVTEKIHSLEQLSKAKKQAENAAKSKSDFLANMSHEIRTPMNGVLGTLQLLRKTPLNEKQLKQINTAISSADSLLVLINDILDFSKIEAGKLSIESIHFNLRDQINCIIDTVSHLIDKDRPVKFVVESQGVDGRTVVGDPTRLQQVILNLLTNAIKFTKSGEIRFKFILKEKSESLYLFKCSVQDTGIGVEQGKLEELFLEFTQADASTTREYGGTGLGLSICRKLCEMMGGSIYASSVLGKGSCFSFEVELGRSQNINSNSLEFNLQMESEDKITERFSNRKILLVEDNEINQFVAEGILEDFGVMVDISSNGIEALESLNNDSYALVLMDCQMPEMDGYEATAKIRCGEAGEKNKKIPIIAMTANAMQGDKERCIDAGMDDYMSKPIEERVLQNMFVKWLG